MLDIIGELIATGFGIIILLCPLYIIFKGIQSTYRAIKYKENRKDNIQTAIICFVFILCLVIGFYIALTNLSRNIVASM